MVLVLSYPMLNFNGSLVSNEGVLHYHILSEGRSMTRRSSVACLILMEWTASSQDAFIIGHKGGILREGPP